MANRRIGQGMGGRPFYGGGGSGGGGGGAVNPWEGGNVPGGNRGGMMNSFNSGNQSNILSQLSEPQAQLALALTKLLQPQQQQVPSLLTMDTVNPLASNNMYPNDYPQRGRLDFNRRPRPDFRRNEPFNKVCFLFIIIYHFFLEYNFNVMKNYCSIFNSSHYVPDFIPHSSNIHI